MNSNWLRPVLSMAILLLASACAPGPRQEGPQPDTGEASGPGTSLARAAAVAVSYDDIDLPVGSKVALLAPEVAPGARALAPDDQAGLMRELVSDALSGLGYQIASDSDLARMRVGWFIATEDDISDAALLERFGIDPGIGDASLSADYAKGTVVIQALDGRGERLLWRGAMQGYAHQKVSAETRRKRLSQVVMRIMSSFPPATQAGPT